MGTLMADSKLLKIRAAALDLADAERAELARDLLASLDGPPDLNAGEAWNREIERRLAEVEAGTASVIDSDEMLRRIDERLRQG
jgi:putative addiction module component (TIGR02574 family)